MKGESKEAFGGYKCSQSPANIDCVVHLGPKSRPTCPLDMPNYLFPPSTPNFRYWSYRSQAAAHRRCRCVDSARIKYRQCHKLQQARSINLVGGFTTGIHFKNRAWLLVRLATDPLATLSCEHFCFRAHPRAVKPLDRVSFALRCIDAVSQATCDGEIHSTSS
jgi:hypothetical protein